VRHRTRGGVLDGGVLHACHGNMDLY
jgi:hypothetical protein